MKIERVAFACLSVLCVASLASAQVPSVRPNPEYREFRKQFDQAFSRATTNERRLQLYRQTVARGQHSGQKLLTHMFHDFGPEFRLSPTTPGLSGTVHLLRSYNRNVVVGNARTLAYANALQTTDAFRVLGINQIRVNAYGKTDADIHFQHIESGSRGRVEVKNVKTSNQRIDEVRKQIRKMAEDARLTGEIQILASRFKIRPEIRSFAERHGIVVVDRLRTGDFQVLEDDVRFSEFAKDLDRHFRTQAKLNALAGSAQLGMRAYLAYQSALEIKHDLTTDGGADIDRLLLSEHGSAFIGGVGLSAEGRARIARQLPALANSARLVALTRWGRRFGTGGTVLAEAFVIARYADGNLTQREFLHAQASLGGSFAGGAAGGFAGLKAGALAGGAIGSLFGPEGTVMGAGIGGTIGAMSGSVGGGFAGAHFAGSGVEELFRLQDNEQREQFAEFLLIHYQ